MISSIPCIVVDDNELSRKTIETLVGRVNNWKLVESCSSALQAREVLHRKKVDVIFLDVEMPELSGIEFLRSLSTHPEIIIISAKEKYAVDAFEFEVTDYLLKPVSLDRFLKAIERVEKRLKTDQENYSSADSVFVKSSGQMISIKFKDIAWVEAYGDYVNIFTENDRHVVHATMKGIEEKLPRGQFMRVHRSFIIPVDKINSIEDSGVIIGKKSIPIGESYKNELMKRLNFL